MTLSSKPKNPIFGLGKAFNQGLIGDFTLEVRGSGLVATLYGMPGVSATLVATGLYDIRFPFVAERGMRMYPHVMAAEPKGPTGAFIGPQGSGFVGVVPNVNAHVSHVGGQSGGALLNITNPFQGASSAAGGNMTGFRPVNPPTGTTVNVLVLGSPISRY